MLRPHVVRRRTSSRTCGCAGTCVLKFKSNCPAVCLPHGRKNTRRDIHHCSPVRGRDCSSVRFGHSLRVCTMNAQTPWVCFKMAPVERFVATVSCRFCLTTGVACADPLYSENAKASAPTCPPSARWLSARWLFSSTGSLSSLSYPDNYPSGCAINDGEGRIRERPRTYRSHKALLWYNRKHRVSMG